MGSTQHPGIAIPFGVSNACELYRERNYLTELGERFATYVIFADYVFIRHCRYPDGKGKLFPLLVPGCIPARSTACEPIAASRSLSGECNNPQARLHFRWFADENAFRPVKSVQKCVHPVVQLVECSCR